jgi:MFS family permease
MLLADLIFYRIPRQSRGFWKAQLADAFGTALLLGAIYPFVGVIARRMGATPALITLLSMAPFIGALTTPVVARLRTYVRMGVVLGVLRVLSAGVLLATAGASTPAVLIAIVLLSQAFRVGGSVGINSLMRSHVVTRARPGIMQAARIIMFAATLPIAYISGRLLDTLGADGYRTVFPAAAAVSVLLALPFFLLLRRPRETVDRKKGRLIEEIGILKSDRRYAVFMLIFFVGTLGEKISMPVNPLLFADVLDFKNEQVALAMGVTGPALAVAGFLFWGQLLKRTDPLPVLAACMLLKAARPVLWALAPEMDSPLLWICLGEGTFRFLIAGIEMGVLLTIMKMSSPQQVPIYMGIHFLLMAARGIGGPLLGLTLLHAGVSIPNVYWVVFGVVLAGGVLLAALAVAWRDGGTTGNSGACTATP